jgi:hypothetical protein
VAAFQVHLRMCQEGRRRTNVKLEAQRTQPLCCKWELGPTCVGVLLRGSRRRLIYGSRLSPNLRARRGPAACRPW